MLTNQDFTQERRHYLGGSDIGALLGLSSYKTPLDLWLEKTGKVNPHADSLPLRFGSFAEEFVASEYAKVTNSRVIADDRMVLHPEYAHFRAHIDRFVFTQNSQGNDLSPNGNHAPQVFNQDGQCLAQYLLECKTTSPFMQHHWGEEGTANIPLSYLCQCAWYLAVTQMGRIDLAVLIGNSELRSYVITRDLELEKLLIQKANYFWNEYIQKDCPPKPTTEKDYLKLFPKSIPSKSIEAKPEILSQIEKYKRLNEKIKADETKISEIKMTLMQEMGEAEILCLNKEVLITWKQTKGSVRFDTKRFEQDYPELALRYQIQGDGTRRFTVKNPS